MMAATTTEQQQQQQQQPPREGAQEAQDDPTLAVRDEWLAVAMAAAAERAAGLEPTKAEALLERARVAREQVRLLQRYTYICGLLTRYDMRLDHPQQQQQQPEGEPSPPPLVSMRFPVQLLPNTHRKFVDGLGGSFAAFVSEVYRAALTTNVDALELGANERFQTETAEFANTMAADLWVQTTKIFSRECGEATARARLLGMLDEFATRAIDQERDRLRRLHGHCACVRDACGDFGRRRLRGNKARDPLERQRAARRWLVSAGRGGAYAAVHVLAKHPRQTKLFAQLDVGQMIAAFGLTSAGRLDDDKAGALYDCMESAHVDLGATMNWEVRRAEWLADAANAPATHPCWSGVVVAPDACDHHPDERLLQAPSHMGCFATGRLRIVADPLLLRGTTAYTCGLARVRVARVLAQLLREGHLPLHRLGCAFARRVATCEFAKYEHAAHNVEAETLAAFGKEVGVAYAAGALPSAMNRILSEGARGPNDDGVRTGDREGINRVPLEV